MQLISNSSAFEANFSAPEQKIALTLVLYTQSCYPTRLYRLYRQAFLITFNTNIIF